MLRDKGLFLLNVLFLLLSLSGCAANVATGPVFDHVLEPEKAMATIYFYRSTDVYGIQTLDTIPVSMDGRVIGELYRGGYFIFKAHPGKYRLNTNIKGGILDTILEIELKENKVYFIKSVFRSVVMSNTNSLHVIEDNKAISELQNYRQTSQ
jgi:hypothetical protein